MTTRRTFLGGLATLAAVRTVGEAYTFFCYSATRPGNPLVAECTFTSRGIGYH